MANAERADIEHDQIEVRRILGLVGGDRLDGVTLSDRLDAVVLHPVLGPVILAVILFLVFQAVFAWAQVPMDEIKLGVSAFGNWLAAALPASLLKDLLINGVLAGVGSVLVFLPQIIILFFFILVLEDSGYLPRAAFLLDRVMGSVGLSGRAFIPLLSSFACAIPGIMATRTIQNPRDRLATIMIAPLMTCSARLPVYALIIGAFIPRRTVWGGMELQGVVLFALYIAGVASAMAVAFVLKRSGPGARLQALMLELPAYHWPNLRNLGVGLWQRVEIFMSRVGTIILALMVILWALSSFPAPPPGATGPAIQYSIAGHLGAWLAVLFAPDRIQLADLDCAGAGTRGTRGRRRRAGHGLRPVRDRQRRERRADAADLPIMEFADRALAARVVRIRAAVPLDSCHGQARDQFLALSRSSWRRICLRLPT